MESHGDGDDVKTARPSTATDNAEQSRCDESPAAHNSVQSQPQIALSSSRNVEAPTCLTEAPLAPQDREPGVDATTPLPVVEAPATSVPDAPFGLGAGSTIHSLAFDELYPPQVLSVRSPLRYHERGFSRYFLRDVGGIKGNDQYIYRHANGLIVVGLAPSHAALAADRVISAVDFHVGKRSRLEMEATGKNKQRATPLDANSALCKIVMVTPPPDTVTATDTGTISGGDANAATTVPNVTESNPTAVSCTTNAAPGSSAAGSGSTISVSERAAAMPTATDTVTATDSVPTGNTATTGNAVTAADTLTGCSGAPADGSELLNTNGRSRDNEQKQLTIGGNREARLQKVPEGGSGAGFESRHENDEARRKGPGLQNGRGEMNGQGYAFYVARCCVKGRLIEVNRQLATNPILLRDKAASEGYIAVLLPHPAEWAAAQPRLLTEEQYESADI